MSENAKAPERTPLDFKKLAHDYYATAIELLTNRVRYAPEEFEGVHQTLNFLRQNKDAILADIHKEEPPAPPQPKENYDMDLTHLKVVPPEAQDAVEHNGLLDLPEMTPEQAAAPNSPPQAE